MSLINKMLQDLDARGGQGASSVQDEIKPVPLPERGVPARAIGVGVAVLALIGAGSYGAWRYLHRAPSVPVKPGAVFATAPLPAKPTGAPTPITAPSAPATTASPAGTALAGDHAAATPGAGALTAGAPQIASVARPGAGASTAGAPQIASVATPGATAGIAPAARAGASAGGAAVGASSSRDGRGAAALDGSAGGVPQVTDEAVAKSASESGQLAGNASKSAAVDRKLASAAAKSRAGGKGSPAAVASAGTRGSSAAVASAVAKTSASAKARVAGKASTGTRATVKSSAEHAVAAKGPRASAAARAANAKDASRSAAAKDASKSKLPVTTAIAATPQAGKQMTPQQQAESLYHRANASLEDGRVSEAMSLLNDALKINPRHDAARQTLVGLLVEARRPEEAMRLLQTGLTLDPRQPNMAMLLARLQMERGGDGIDTLQRTLPYALGNAEYQGFLAGALQRAQRHREAIEQFQAALKVSPTNGVWWMGLGLSLQSEKRTTEALDAFRRAKASGTLSAELQAFTDRKIQQLSH